MREQRLHELPRGVVLGREGLAAEEPEGDVRRRELPNHPGHLVGTINISLAFHAVIQFTKQRDVYQKTQPNLRQLPDFFLMKESQRAHFVRQDGHNGRRIIMLDLGKEIYVPAQYPLFVRKLQARQSKYPRGPDVHVYKVGSRI